MRISDLLFRRSKSANRSAIEETATRLFLAARAHDDPRDWDAAYRWIAQDPHHGVAFAKAEAGWRLAARLADARPARAPEPVPEHGTTLAGILEPLFGLYAAAIALTAGILAITGAVAVQKWVEVQRFDTPVGGERSLVLADGSTIRLNTDSAVEVGLRKDLRFVRLLRGEARFDVARDDGRPFVVKSRTTVMRVLGTTFNVRLRPEVTELTVVDGRVAVRDGIHGGATVAAGDGAAIYRGSVSISRLDSQQIVRRTAWKDGLIRFDGDPLVQAVEEFNRYRSVPLVIGDQQLAGLRVDGAFRADESDRFVATLVNAGKVRMLTNEDRSIILLEP